MNTKCPTHLTGGVSEPRGAYPIWLVSLRRRPLERTMLEPVATILLPNSVALPGIEQNSVGRLSQILQTIHYLLGQDRIRRDGSNRISSAVLSTTQPPLRGRKAQTSCR